MLSLNKINNKKKQKNKYMHHEGKGTRWVYQLCFFSDSSQDIYMQLTYDSNIVYVNVKGQKKDHHIPKM